MNSGAGGGAGGFKGGSRLLATGFVRFAAQVNDGDALTIGGVEAWTARDSDPGANEYLKGGTDILSAASLAAAINADAGSLVAASHITGTKVVQLVSKAASGTLSLAENTSGARLVVPSAGMIGAKPVSAKTAHRGQYVLTADDISVLDPDQAGQPLVVASIPSSSSPIIDSVSVVDSTNVFKTLAALEIKLVQAGSNRWALVLNEVSTPGRILDPGDKINYVLSA